MTFGITSCHTLNAGSYLDKVIFTVSLKAPNRSATLTSLKLTCVASGEKVAMRGDRIQYMTLRFPDCREGGNRRVGQALLIDWIFFTALGETLMKQKCIGGNAQGRMVIQPSPISPLVLSETKLLLQFPVVTLNAPAHLGDIHQLLDRGSTLLPLIGSINPRQ